MKKLICIITAVLFILPLSACKKGKTVDELFANERTGYALIISAEGGKLTLELGTVNNPAPITYKEYEDYLDTVSKIEELKREEEERAKAEAEKQINSENSVSASSNVSVSSAVVSSSDTAVTSDDAVSSEYTKTEIPEMPELPETYTYMFTGNGKTGEVDISAVTVYKIIGGVPIKANTKALIKDMFVKIDKTVMGYNLYILENCTRKPDDYFEGDEFNGKTEIKITEDCTVSNTTYNTVGGDTNALRIAGATVTASNITVNKSGGSDNQKNTTLYGLNSAALITGGANATIKDSTAVSTAFDSSAFYLYGKKTQAVFDAVIVSSVGENSNGIYLSENTKADIKGSEITAAGDGSASLVNFGNVSAENSSFISVDSVCVKSSADITADGCTFTSKNNQVINSTGNITLKNCTVNGGDSKGTLSTINLYGDKTKFASENCAYIGSNADLFKVSGKAEINLLYGNVSAVGGYFLNLADGADVTLTLSGVNLSAPIAYGKTGNITVNLEDSAYIYTKFSDATSGASVKLNIGTGCTVVLTGDTYLTSVTGDTSGIVKSGHKLFVGGVEVK